MNQPRFYYDNEGHQWPITGHTCTDCRLPLDRIHPAQTIHPTCDYKESPHDTPTD